MSPRIDSQFPAQLAVKLVAKHRKRMKFTAAANFLKVGCLSILGLSGRGIIRVEAIVSSIVCIMRGGMYYCCLHLDVTSKKWKRYSSQTPLYIIQTITISPPNFLLLCPSQGVSES